jgi:hypothetical protein
MRFSDRYIVVSCSPGVKKGFLRSDIVIVASHWVVMCCPSGVWFVLEYSRDEGYKDS